MRSGRMEFLCAETVTLGFGSYLSSLSCLVSVAVASAVAVAATTITTAVAAAANCLNANAEFEQNIVGLAWAPHFYAHLIHCSISMTIPVATCLATSLPRSTFNSKSPNLSAAPGPRPVNTFSSCTVDEPIFILPPFICSSIPG